MKRFGCAIVLCLSCGLASAAQTLPMISIDGDRFVADGKEFKIWGFNQGLGLHLPDDVLQRNVDQLAFLGCNMLRLHAIDWSVWGDGADPNGKEYAAGLLPLGPDRKSTQYLVNVDEFYRFLDALREKGIYVAITLSVCSNYVPGDVGILQTTPEDAEAWQAAIEELNAKGPELQCFKILPVIDERSLELRKCWAANLLSLRNPRTGVKLAEDSQLALLNTVNECSMWKTFFRDNHMRELPEYFVSKVRVRWNEWLRDTYGKDAGLAAAWKEEGKKGLLPGESLDAGTVQLLPLDPVGLKSDEEKEEKAFPHYADQRRDDYIQFLFDMDAAHQRTMRAHFRSLGWTRPSGYGDSVAIGAEIGKLWLKSDLLPYIEEHPYDDANVDLFMWDKIRVCTYCGSNFLPWQGQDRPMWASEIRCSNNGLGWSRIPFPLFVAAYHALEGRDGNTWHVWAMERSRQLASEEENMANIDAFHCNWDIPWLFSYRAAGRLFKSCGIRELPKDDPARERFAQWEANFTNDQIHRIHGQNQAILTVNTDHFRAVTTPYPQVVELGDVTINLTSETYNVVVVEKLSDNEIEVTAVGKSGEFEMGKVNHFDPIEWVTGSVRVRGRTVESVQYIDHHGAVTKTVDGDQPEVALVPGTRLYRARLK